MSFTGSSETRKHILQDVAESRTDAVIELKEERQFDPPHELEPLTRSSALDQGNAPGLPDFLSR